jgi:hypothetical protein
LSIPIAAGLILLGAPAAMAVSWNGGMTGSDGKGTVTISSSITEAYGRVSDVEADGHCARFKANWDIRWAPDITTTVATACGNGTTDYGSYLSETKTSARDFEIRIGTGDDYVIVWQGNINDA